VHLLTGSTGIGAATAERLVADGASVFVVSRTDEHVAELVQRLSATGAMIDGIAADLAHADQADEAVAACVARYGRIDGVLSVAGGSGRRFGDGLMHETSADAWDRTIELNLRSQANVARAAIRHLLAQGGPAAMVLVSSVLAASPVPELFGTHAYAAAKGGIVSLGLSMAAAYAGRGIRVNIIAPGLVATPMAERAARDPAIVAFAARKQPLTAGLVDARDVAEAAAFLLGPASSAITGQVLAVDGGWSVTSAGPGVPEGPP
jgi:NAD(P)-dependent dehydrogenase (short-subunit alcohol dehydrogenase family)